VFLDTIQINFIRQSANTNVDGSKNYKLTHKHSYFLCAHNLRLKFIDYTKFIANNLSFSFSTF